MPLDLSDRQWPERDTETRSTREGWELVRSARATFVGEGALIARAIDFGGQMRALPRESSAISALGYDNGAVYGATRGEASWLFQYLLPSYTDAAIPLCPVPDCTDVGGIVVSGSRAWLAANHAGEGRILEITGLGWPGDVIQEWSMIRPQFETVATPAPGEPILRLLPSRVGDLLYGLTASSGTLFSFRPDNREVRLLGAVDPVKFFGPALVEDGAGCWYAFGTLGRVVRYDPATGTLEPTSVRVPCFPGRGPYARISAAACDPAGDRLYVGDSEGLLSLITPDNGTVTTLGKPVPLGGIDHLVCLRDGRVYGVAGGREGMSHLFVHEPERGSLRDLGVCCTTVEKGWYGYRFGAMLATPEGRIVLGEDDHLGCLFSYFPPLP